VARTLLVTENHPDEKRRGIVSNCISVCRHFCNECLGVVAVPLLRVQEVSGLSFALECPTDFLWFYWAPADKVLDIA